MTLIEIIYTILIIGMWCNGFHKITDKGMLLEMIGNMLLRLSETPKYISWLADPLGNCIYCMASIHGLLVFILLHAHDLSLWPYALVCLVSSVYINGLLKNLTDIIFELSEAALKYRAKK